MTEGSYQGVLDFNLEDSFLIQSYSPFMVTVKTKYLSPGQAQTVSSTKAAETDETDENEESESKEETQESKPES